MRNLIRLASVGVGAAIAIGGAASGASASTATTAKTAVAQASPSLCTMTITHPASIYVSPNFTNGRYIYGKHTGEKVTSSWDCAYFQNGFHEVRLSSGGSGWIYASDLGQPSPRPAVESRYKITGSVHVRSAPSTTRGAIIGTKTAGQVVTSPLYKGDFDNDGFAEVLMGNGNIGWISSAYVQ